MKANSIDNFVFYGLILTMIYQYTLLYLSVIDGSWISFLVISLAFILGLFLGRTTYIILGGVLSFVSMSIGGLMLMITYTRAMYFLPAIALLTITPLTTYLMYLLDHQWLKRRALVEELEQLQQEKPDLELVTGTLNGNALNNSIARELELLQYHGKDYRFTLTMAKIDFLENVVNTLGNQRFNQLLKATSQHLDRRLFNVDRLFYIGNGRFVILSPMLNEDNAPIMRKKIKIHIDDIAEEFGLARNALVLRLGQVTYTDQVLTTERNVERTLQQLERSAETEIVKEY